MKRNKMAGKDLGAMTDRELRNMIEVGVRRGMPPNSVEGMHRALEEALEEAIRDGVSTDDCGRTVYQSLNYKSERKDN